MKKAGDRLATARSQMRAEISSRSGNIRSSLISFIRSPHGATSGAANNGSLCPFMGVLGVTDDHWHERVPRVAMDWATVDVGVASCLHPVLGLGQSAALVRCRGAPCLRRFVVGKLLVDFQPSRQLAGCGDLLGH